MKPGTLLKNKYNIPSRFRVYLDEDPLKNTVRLLAADDNGFNVIVVSKNYVEDWYEIVPMETEDNSQ